MIVNVLNIYYWNICKEIGTKSMYYPRNSYRIPENRKLYSQRDTKFFLFNSRNIETEENKKEWISLNVKFKESKRIKIKKKMKKKLCGKLCRIIIEIWANRF